MRKNNNCGVLQLALFYLNKICRNVILYLHYTDESAVPLFSKVCFSNSVILSQNKNAGYILDIAF
jgi:hypothetical protein